MAYGTRGGWTGFCEVDLYCLISMKNRNVDQMTVHTMVIMMDKVSTDNSRINIGCSFKVSIVILGWSKIMMAISLQ